MVYKFPTLSFWNLRSHRPLKNSINNQLAQRDSLYTAWQWTAYTSGLRHTTKKSAQCRYRPYFPKIAPTLVFPTSLLHFDQPRSIAENNIFHNVTLNLDLWPWPPAWPCELACQGERSFLTKTVVSPNGTHTYTLQIDCSAWTIIVAIITFKYVYLRVRDLRHFSCSFCMEATVLRLVWYLYVWIFKI